LYRGPSKEVRGTIVFGGPTQKGKEAQMPKAERVLDRVGDHAFGSDVMQ